MKHLVIAPHPDDETLGCGGTLLRMKDMGHSIHWCIVTRPISNKDNTINFTENDAQILQNVSEQYGFDTVHELALPTTRLDTLPKGDIVSALSGVFQEVQPTTVYLPFWADAHSDHSIVFEAAWSCCKIFRYPSVKKIFCMQMPSETDFSPSHVKSPFIPSVYVDISLQTSSNPELCFFDKKQSILSIYKSELGEHPFPRSLVGTKALATIHGATAGCRYAEAFMLIKEII